MQRRIQTINRRTPALAAAIVLAVAAVTPATPSIAFFTVIGQVAQVMFSMAKVVCF